MITTTQPQLLPCSLTETDRTYTPAWCARDVVDFCKPSGKILEPAKGEGIFLRFMEAEWCEIQEGKDFFRWTAPMDWIVGNPPYSLWKEWLQHSMEIAPNIVYVIPIRKMFSSMNNMRMLKAWGWIKHIRIYGTGYQLQFDMGNPIGAMDFMKDYAGDTAWSWYERKEVRGWIAVSVDLQR